MDGQSKCRAVIIWHAEKPDLAELLPFCFYVNSSLSAPQRIPNSRYREIEEAGHSVYFEKPREFNDAVLAFLKKQRLVSA